MRPPPVSVSTFLPNIFFLISKFINFIFFSNFYVLWKNDVVRIFWAHLMKPLIFRIYNLTFFSKKILFFIFSKFLSLFFYIFWPNWQSIKIPESSVSISHLKFSTPENFHNWNLHTWNLPTWNLDTWNLHTWKFHPLIFLRWDFLHWNFLH